MSCRNTSFINYQIVRSVNKKKEPTRSTDEVVKLFNINSEKTLFSKIRAETFPEPDLVIKTLTSNIIKKAYWRVSTLKKHASKLGIKIEL